MKTILDPRDKAEVARRIMSIQPDSPRRWGSMSPHQTVCHLADAFSTALGDREAKDTSTIFTRTVLRFIALTAPVRWPKGVMTTPEINQEIGGTPPEEFQADLNRLTAELDAFLERLDPSTMRHPIFGRCRKRSGVGGGTGTWITMRGNSGSSPRTRSPVESSRLPRDGTSEAIPWQTRA